MVGEGSPVSFEIIAVLEKEWRDLGEHEAADALLCAADCWFRWQDIERLLCEDLVIAADGGVSVLLGVRKRGGGDEDRARSRCDPRFRSSEGYPAEEKTGSETRRSSVCSVEEAVHCSLGFFPRQARSSKAAASQFEAFRSEPRRVHWVQRAG